MPFARRLGSLLAGLPLFLLGVPEAASGSPAGVDQASRPADVSLAAARATAGPRARSVVVLAYNIERGADGSRRLRAVAREIRSSGAAIVGLNEIDSRRGGILQARWLARRLGMRAVYYPNVDLGDGWQRGNAVLSRYRILAHRNTPLPGRPGSVPRSLLRTTIALGGGVTVRVAVTHLQPGGDLRVVQARRAAALIGRPRCATFLLGDLNAGPGSRAHDALTRHLRDPWVGGRFGPGHTFPSSQPSARIDYTLVGHRATVQASRVMPLWSSDHRAVRTRFRVPRGASCG